VVHPDGEFLSPLQGFASLFGEAVNVHAGIASSELESKRRASHRLAVCTIPAHGAISCPIPT